MQEVLLPQDTRRKRGFTLLEMVAVVAIIGILMTLVGTQIIAQLDKVNRETTRAKIAAITSSLEMYRLDNGRYPTTEQGLAALLNKPTSDPEPRRYLPGGYIKAREHISDAWGLEFQYASPGTHNPRDFDLWSLGADGEPGGTDNAADLGNWEDDQVAGG